MQELIKSKQVDRERLDKEISELKIKIDMKQNPKRICPKCKKGFMYDDGFVYADFRVCSNCKYNVGV